MSVFRKIVISAQQGFDNPNVLQHNFPTTGPISPLERLKELQYFGLTNIDQRVAGLVQYNILLLPEVAHAVIAEPVRGLYVAPNLVGLWVAFGQYGARPDLNRLMALENMVQTYEHQIR